MRWPWVRREGLRLLWMLIGALAAIGNVGFTVLHNLLALGGLWFVWTTGTEHERR